MKQQDGFTIIELLVALVIGLIITSAALTAFDRSYTVQASITTRTDNAQRARLAMDLIIRELRSQVCTGPGGPSLQEGTPTSISFVTDLGDGSTVPELRKLTFDATARVLRDYRYRGTRTTDSISFTSSPTARGTTLTDVEQDGTTPIFGYWGYDTALPPRPTIQMTTPLSATDRARVARITVAFRLGPAANKRDRKTAAVLQDEIFLRSVDPADPVPLPLCS